MVYHQFMTPHEVALHIAQAAKNKRLLLNLSQKNLAKRSGVSLGVLKKFECVGKISLESLLKLALVLDALGDFVNLFQPPPLESLPTLESLLKQKQRKRGRQ